MTDGCNNLVQYLFFIFYIDYNNINNIRLI